MLCYTIPDICLKDLHDKNTRIENIFRSEPFEKMRPINLHLEHMEENHCMGFLLFSWCHNPYSGQFFL